MNSVDILFLKYAALISGLHYFTTYIFFNMKTSRNTLVTVLVYNEDTQLPFKLVCVMEQSFNT